MALLPKVEFVDVSLSHESEKEEAVLLGASGMTALPSDSDSHPQDEGPADIELGQGIDHSISSARSARRYPASEVALPDHLTILFVDDAVSYTHLTLPTICSV